MAYSPGFVIIGQLFEMIVVIIKYIGHIHEVALPMMAYMELTGGWYATNDQSAFSWSLWNKENLITFHAWFK